MTVDPIVALESLGYTEREAAFLYLVGVHAGYFLRRQFDYFVDRNKGAIAMRFLEKARIAGHIEFLDCKQGWYVYHLYSRAIYRLLGNPDSQLRRKKGDAQIRARLMALDYVLENENDHFLESEAERLSFFAEHRRIALNLFTDDGKLHPLLATFPISIVDRTRPTQSSVRFSFIDEGQVTIEKFLRFLSVADPLLRGVGNFEIVYVSGSTFNFPAAKKAFWSCCSSAAHRSQRLFEEDVRDVYTQHRMTLQACFTTLLLEYGYPRLRRSEVRGSKEGSHAEQSRTGKGL